MTCEKKPSLSRLTRSIRYALLASATTTFSALPAYAQEQQARDAVLPAVEVTGQQETATSPVQGYRATRAATATKTDTPLAETPQSVTVVTRDQMTDQGATNLQDALTYAAGVRSDAYGVDSRNDAFTIRGATPTTYVDGMRQTNGYYTSSVRPDPFTLERIEVLRGPSAMMYGQGSTGGVVNLVSKRPQETFQGEVGVQLGTFGRKQLQADVTGPLSEDGKWLYRLVAVARDSDTQVDFVGDDRFLLAPSLTWKPSDRTTLTFQASHQRDRTGSTAQFLPWAGMVTPNVSGQIPSSRFIGEPTDRYDTDRTTVGYLLEHKFNEQWMVRQNMRYARNKVDYVTHYADSFATDPSTGQPGGWAIDPVNQRLIRRIAGAQLDHTRITTIDQHLQGNLQTGNVKHTVLAGLDYTDYQLDSARGSGSNTIDVYAPVYGNPVSMTLVNQPRNTQKQTGVYLQDQMKFGEKWIAVLGVRHDRVTNGLAGSADNKDSATTGRLGLMYLMDNGWSPYVSYSESFTPLTGTDRLGTRYKPLEGEQIEAGVKYMPADGKSQFTAAIWKIKEKNQQTNDPVNPLFRIQVDSTKNKGLELEWRAAVTPTFDAIAHYNYLDLDDKLTGIPKHQAAAWGKWKLNVGDVSGLSFGAGVRYMSSFKDGIAPTTPSVTLLDTMLSWDNGQWRYALNINNLTDKLYNAACLLRGDCWYGARRTAVASATYRF
ncbi:TonB-dependent siderophore receptor [Oxalicibacterium faecigallinarum]|uniref:Ferrisiderophore receptor n=1 Tax=Oxalicibacterium faecigallinarum TaxID=573741 RepID=A0A8J3AMV4_9BURK|nr:TonB-dependent siderophore receptor [Oxalicibacterium faecigallinarum]GGI16673.1 ferrisiderophore receptor [Oxalicibacterium faecigallinarum]